MRGRKTAAHFRWNWFLPVSTYLLFEIAVITLCLAGGGVLKGATGAGAPVLAVPALAAFFDVRFAVIIMLAPNLLTNAVQAWRFREHRPPASFMIPLLIGGVIGIIVGTLALKSFGTRELSLLVAFAVFGYVALRLARPHWSLPMAAGRLLALPVGALAGLLQGAAGLSAPASITFMNALQLGRDGFIAAISTFFAVFTSAQVIAVAYSGLMQPGEVWLSLLALLPVTLAMPLGSWIGRRVNPQTLDRLILGLLLVIAVKLVWDALSV